MVESSTKWIWQKDLEKRLKKRKIRVQKHVRDVALPIMTNIIQPIYDGRRTSIKDTTSNPTMPNPRANSIISSKKHNFFWIFSFNSRNYSKL
ncbi:unnamed protein product [Bursaphelenchus xylophilus]|uniref:(pine wood nematode) hypothetical protein n=1 Tax=Bursaphelenchus xylophilus TaxID=6326 RepID=A0A1I7RV48_BURXY|nr:unnamed protein product [Bursaphelenchus xylophilus]CAG9105115.1 unnamed protein product [Bursaphelenchus xylophilus]